jgi:glycosyltransferase involved in cell wall biosynthesis
MRLLFIVSEDWYFLSHRLHLGTTAVRVGYKVALLTRVSSHRQQIEDAGIEVIPWNLERGSRNPFKELQALADVVGALRRFKPDLIHAVALKPTIYSAVASRLAGIDRRVLALAGLGFVFTSKRFAARLLQPLLLLCLRFAFSGEMTRLILQNPDDVSLLTGANVLDAARVRLIRGAGVDTATFAAQAESIGVPVVVLPARMLWDKGVADFVECARELRDRGVRARFALVGDRDVHNPGCVPQGQLEQWAQSGVVEWWGRRDDMAAVFAQANVVCLPTFREGLPKALLEAASCARPIVTYDVPGCREVVRHRVNGILVPERNTKALCDAVAELLSDPSLRREMGEAGREIVVREFAQERIAAETAAVWRELTEGLDVGGATTPGTPNVDGVAPSAISVEERNCATSQPPRSRTPIAKRDRGDLKLLG